MTKFESSDLPFYEILSNQSIEYIKETLTLVYLPKGHQLMQHQEGIYKAFIIKKGIIRTYLCKEDKQITFDFAREKDIIASTGGYFYQTVNSEEFELLENCTLYEINLRAMKTLFHTNLEICNWARHITEYNAIRTQQYLLNQLLLTPEERYKQLIIEDRELLERVALKEIATFLGISAISLSRIRKRI